MPSKSGESKRGFAAMSSEKQREIASMGGKASHGGGRRSSNGSGRSGDGGGRSGGGGGR